MSRTYKFSEIRDASVWLTEDGGERFRITNRFETPCHYVVWAFFDDGRPYPFDSAGSIAGAFALIERASAKGAAA